MSFSRLCLCPTKSRFPETETDHSGGRVHCASTGSAAIEDFDKSAARPAARQYQRLFQLVRRREVRGVDGQDRKRHSKNCGIGFVDGAVVTV